MDKLIITCALTGTTTTKEQNSSVPVTPEEIAADAVKVVRAGASVLHIHVRDENGLGTMAYDAFEKTFNCVTEALKSEGLDAVINLTTSGRYGGTAPLEERVGHLKRLRPEMCSFDSCTMNWGCSIVFDNHPTFLEELAKVTLDYDVKPEIEIFDGGHISNAIYYINHGMIKAPAHFQFVLNILGGLEGTTRNLQFLLDRLPEGSTWSVTGIGKSHVPMMLAGLSLGCNGLRVGLEDNIYYSNGVKTTNEQLVKRACELGKLAGREIADAEDARRILNITRKSF